jgi:flagellar biosynthesis/type III secretory pathway protein FliH
MSRYPNSEAQSNLQVFLEGLYQDYSISAVRFEALLSYTQVALNEAYANGYSKGYDTGYDEGVTDGR